MNKQVVYHLFSQAGRGRWTLQAVKLNEANEQVVGQEHTPLAADIVAYIRNMPTRDKQRVFRDLIKELADQAKAPEVGRARAKK